MKDGNNTLKELNELKGKLESQLQAINETIRLYELNSQLILIHQTAFHANAGTTTSPRRIENSNDYNRNGSFKYKITYVLSKANRFLSLKEIADMVSQLEPESDIEAIKRGVGSAKSNLLKEKKIVKYVVGKSNNNSFYGREIWLDVNGVPHDQHNINESALTKKEETELF
ncbi:hypothetical protein GZH53_15795 [Flavihumibacter sp. R14]|nr:hypothetical protein [Flavihumibacter soli]